MKRIFLLFAFLLCFSSFSVGAIIPRTESFRDEQNVTVKVSGLFDASWLVEREKQLGQVGNLSLYFEAKQYGVVSTGGEPRVEYESTYSVIQDMSVLVLEKNSVTIGSPFNGSVYILPGSTLSELVQQCQLDPQSFTFIKKSSWEVLEMSYVLEDGDQLALCHNVTVSNATGLTFFFVEHQEPLQSNSDLVQFASGYHLANGNNNSKTEVPLTLKVESDLKFVLCSLVTTDGAAALKFLVESGVQELGDTALANYLNPSQYYEVWDSVDQSRFYHEHDTITKDTRMTISDKCDDFNKAQCWNVRDICEWNKKNSFCVRKGDLDNGVGPVSAAVIAVCVCVGVAVIIVVIGAIVFVIKKRKD